MKNFIVINEEFQCQNCENFNDKLPGSCRNHCIKCLHSLHVDEENPGDRKSNCFGLMKPIAIEKNGKKGWMIIHKCEKCAKISKNKSAQDDNFDLIIQIAKIPYEPSGSEKTRKKTYRNHR